MHYTRFALLACYFLLACRGYSQVADNFSDAELHQNPTWLGDTMHFIVNASNELQLNATAAGSSQIAVQGNIPNSASWDLRFRLAFAPSGSNLLRIYLQADQENLGSSNAYFIEIGETGSNDALRLFRQETGGNTLLGTGTAGLVANNPDIHLRVTRNLSGQWSLEAASGTAPLEFQFSANDASLSGGVNRYFGLQCVYTISNINKYFFDDINVSLGPPDTEAPILLSAQADNEWQVSVLFNEPVNPVQAAIFSISGGVGTPISATLQPDGRSVVLALSSPLSNGGYTLQCEGIQDVFGNTSLVQTADFQFIKTDVAQEFDILINELMPDPSPAQGLPDVEWLELFNRSNKTIDLATLTIKDASGAPVLLPSYLLGPGQYLAITASSNVGALQAAVSAPVLGVPIGVSTLNNDGDIITLSNLNAEVIDRVAYDLDWHTDAGKKEGGWSLERINPGLPCLEKENWQSCPNATGGTPGQANASLSTLADVSPPRLTQILTESATSLLLTFSEGLDKTSVENPAAYLLSPNRNIASAQQPADNRAQVRLSLSEPLALSTVYSIRASSIISDCSGNPAVSTDTLLFGLAETPQQLDVVLNEIMPKPNPSAGLPAVEWLELYNRSSKIIDLADLRIQDLSGLPVSLPAFMLVPGAIVALTSTLNAPVLQAVTSGKVAAAAFSSSLLNDDGDIITLTNTSGAIIDRVTYDENWHTEEGKEDGGWSLERINPNLPCLGRENWQSCPILPGGTPGAINASYQATSDNSAPILLWAYPETAQSILLSFYEGMDKTSMEDIDSYEIVPPIDIASAKQQASIAQVLLQLSSPMQEGVSYSVTVRSSLTDCSGNAALPSDTAVVGISQIPDPQDIVINEILFNPASGNARYVEFYNRSNKLFDWSKFFIAYTANGLTTTAISQKRLAIPGEYHVFTPDAPNVREKYQNIVYRNVMENALPTLDDQEGQIRLYWSVNGDTVELDELNYSDDWHNGLYSVGDREGVALERIRIDLPSNQSSNWTSASATVTGAPGTPTLPNSQRLSASDQGEDLVQLNPARLSPDGDGYEDFLNIQYQLPKEGYAATVGIFDSDGNRVKYLVRQSLAGTQGTLRWDGDTDDGQKARPGIHILFAELFNPDGTVKVIKKVFVVVAKN
jgi:hypothetical protein